MSVYLFTYFTILWPEIENRISHMLGKCSITELPLQASGLIIFLNRQEKHHAFLRC